MPKSPLHGGKSPLIGKPSGAKPIIQTISSIPGPSKPSGAKNIGPIIGKNQRVTVESLGEKMLDDINLNDEEQYQEDQDAFPEVDQFKNTFNTVDHAAVDEESVEAAYLPSKKEYKLGYKVPS